MAADREKMTHEIDDDGHNKAEKNELAKCQSSFETCDDDSCVIVS